MRRASLLFAAILMVGGSCRCRRAKPSNPNTPPPPIRQGPVIHIPRESGAIQIDGEAGELPWRTQAWVSPVWKDGKGKQAPYTQLKMMANDQNLYVEVYVADQDLRSKGDQVTIHIGPLTILLRPKNDVVPAGVQLKSDFDGTIDNPSDYDEEWVSEMAIPWTLLKSRKVSFRAVRIDAGRFGPPHALAWPRATVATLDFTGSSAQAGK